MGGHLDFSQKCDLKIFPFEAYFNKNGIANILSLAEIRKKYRVTMNTDVCDAMIVHIDEHTYLKNY